MSSSAPLMPTLKTWLIERLYDQLSWFDREKADEAMVHSEELRQESISTRKEAQKIIATVSATTKLRQDYAAAGKRLER